MPDRFQTAGEKFRELVTLMARLRGPGGCPWDRKQTFATLKSYLLEESYEVMDAIDQKDWKGLEEELGDLLLQPVFLAEIAAEEGKFDIAGSWTRSIKSSSGVIPISLLAAAPNSGRCETALGRD